jgi:hypothetical protein
MEFKTTGWDNKDFKLVNRKLRKHFANTTFKNHRGENVTFGNTFKHIESILGLPYTSTSMCPMLILDCNVNIYYDNNFHYSFAALNNKNEVIIVLMDCSENEFYIVLS